MPAKRKMFRKLPRWKKLLFCLVTLLLVVLVIETISYFAIRSLLDTSLAGLQADRDKLAITGIGRKQSGTVVHPYLGWVHDPHSQFFEFDGRRIPINELGFVDDKPSIQKRGPDRVVIGIAGGSVSWQFSVSGERALKAALHRSPKFRGKKIVVVRLAIGAHKQPQQLFALNYLLSLGAEFDYLINIDGFNEVALSYSDTRSRDIFYAYPYGWSDRSVELMDPRKSALALQLLETRGARQRWALRFGGWHRSSPTLNLIWKLRDNGMFAAYTSLRDSIRDSRDAHGLGYLRGGPRANPKTEAEFFRAAARLWKRCSIQLNGACNAGRIEYLHFLQPNQYVKDSKPMDEREREVATKGDPLAAEFADAVKMGYPLLVQEGRDLRKRNIRFHDLTMLFATTTAAVYADGCCHFNKRGYEMLAEAIAAAMIAPKTK